MEDDRTAEHVAFEDAQTADKNAVKLLGEAIESMKTFYRNNPPAALIEKKAWTSVFGSHDKPEPDASFSDKNKAKGEAHGVIGIMEMLKEDLEVELTNEKAYLTEIKPDCDWILAEFGDRRFKRGQEMEGLVETKAMLLSSTPADLVQ